MKKIIAYIAAGALLATSSVAAAKGFEGPFLEANAGYDDVTGQIDTKDVVYGATAGYNVDINGVIVGADVSVDNVFDRSDVGVSGKLGYNINDRVMPYAKVGYANFRDVFSRKLDGLRVGGGLELNLTKNLYTKVEYRYTDFEAGVGKHGVVTGLGIRF